MLIRISINDIQHYSVYVSINLFYKECNFVNCIVNITILYFTVS
jgi:hypothetical protein